MYLCTFTFLKLVAEKGRGPDLLQKAIHTYIKLLSPHAPCVKQSATHFPTRVFFL